MPGFESAPVSGAVAAATGLRPCEWIALERRDVKRADGVVLVERSFSRGHLKAYGKTERSRRRVPLSQQALDALAAMPPRIDTPLVFPSPSCKTQERCSSSA